jgi:3-oxoacyl-[acyl-carrier protein] reductase
MTKSLARALAPEIRVLGVSPGVVETGFVPGRGADFNAKTAATTPLKRVAQPEDVAAAILACATHLTFSTGSTLVVDGGRAL